MFDDLHDPDPPSADSAHFADVAERAHAMRSRRYAAFGAASLAGVVAVGALAFAATGDGDGDLVVLPADSGADPALPLGADTTTTSTTTTTTLPPPTTIRVTTTTEPPPPETTTTTEKPPVTDPPPATTEPPPPETTQAPPATDPPPTTTAPPAPGPVAGPIVAIDGAGDAVLFADSASLPVLLFDGVDPDDPPAGEIEWTAVESITATPDGSIAYISDCCEPAAGSIIEARPPTTATIEDTLRYHGTNPDVDPSGTKVAVSDIVSTVSIYDIGGDPAAAVRAPEPDTPFSIFDLAWSSDSLVVALGSEGERWILRTYTYDGATLTPTNDIVVGSYAPNSNLELGGLDGTASAFVHEQGASTYQVVPLSDVGEPGVRELPGAALSMWISPDGVLTWVDAQRVLRVGDQVVPGEYVWARR